MASIPPATTAFAKVFSKSAHPQFTCLLNTIDLNQTKFILEICHNLLYNSTLSLKEHKRKLRKYSDLYIFLADKSKSLKVKKQIIVQNPTAIKAALTVIASINDRV